MDNVYTLVGVGVLGVVAYAGLMLLLWSLCIAAARADACARDEEQRRRLAVVPRGPR